MKNRTKKILAITGISLGSIIVLLIAAIAIAINFVFTPEKLTPVVLKVANQNLNAKLDMKSVELTFFSTFPRFGVKLTDGTLVSKSIRDSLWQRTDSLLSFKRAIVVVNVVDYLQNKKISLNRLRLDSINVYAFKNKEGVANWDIVKPDTVAETDTTSTGPIASEIDIRRIVVRHATVTYDDRETRVFANLWDSNLKLKAHWQRGHSMLALDFKNKNVLFWQDGELLAHHIATQLKTDVELDRATRTIDLRNALLDVNGVELDIKGTLRGDTVAKALDIDLQYGLHAPSLETVMRMIPESVVKKEEVSAQGDVTLNGIVKGLYGKDKLPMVTLKVVIDKASAKYAHLPYGIDEFKADFFGQIDMTKQQPSYLDLKIFHFKGAHTNILADAKVTDLLGDPDITLNTKSVIDLTALAKTFPLQDGVSIEGNVDADLRVRCRLSSIKKKDLGRIKALGKIKMAQLALRDTNKNFEFTSDASLRFFGNDVLGAQAQIQNIVLHSRQVNSTIENLSASIKTTNPQDTTRIADVQCKVNVQKLKASMPADSLLLFCGKADATVNLQPMENKPTKPQVRFNLKADTLFCKLGENRLGMDKAGIKLRARQIKDSIWIPQGTVGFNRLFVRTPMSSLPIRFQKTAVSVGNRTITLHNATMRIGRSDLTASGSIHNLYGALKRNKMLKATLNLSSRNLNCNQLLRSITFPEDTVQIETDTTSTPLQLFVIPKNIDFELQTNLRRVRYGKMTFRNVHGAVDVRNQAIHLKELSMEGLGATMNTTLIYQARNAKAGYAGFDFKLHNINIGKLVDFIPSLDTIVPMLRSFQGTVEFNVSAESALDSCLNIKIPSLRSAIHVEGDSLVLLDGETFAEISKKFLFKNKERNLIDSIAVNISVADGNVTVYPFVVEMDRYRAAVGGTQDLDMNFNYHISILKSPIPFKLGLNISGNLDKMKFGMGKAKYKDAVTPVEIHKVDSTIVNMGEQIVRDFRRVMRRQSTPSTR
ncbi:MAG TPA: AsmA family protein [Candidatus Barnesiella merdipullorum]|nr:AsmA family protein [Candidatus Barnesiella merdipullorum]